MNDIKQIWRKDESDDEQLESDVAAKSEELPEDAEDDSEVIGHDELELDKLLFTSGTAEGKMMLQKTE